MKKDNTHKQANPLNSFMWGAIVGSAVTYVLSHKKGREILRDISENGVEALQGILDSEQAHEWKEDIKSHWTGRNDEVGEVHNTPAEQSPKKRMFKGVAKK